MRSTALIVIAIVGIGSAHAQAVGYMHTIVAGSNGTETVRAPDSEDDLDTYQRSLIRRMSLRPKTQITIRPSSGQSAYRLFSGLYASVDSMDLVVGIVAGAWRPGNRPETAVLAGLSPDSLTADYLLHLTMFLPSHNAVVFVVAPDGFEFPRTTLAGLATGIEGGGKYLITIRARDNAGYGTLLDRFSDLVDSAWDDSRNDQNSDGALTMSEWLSAFSRRAAGLGLTGTIVRLADGVDLTLRQLRAP